MGQIGKTTVLGILVAAALASECEWGKAQAQAVAGVNARIVATNIPGASAIAQVGTFVTGGTLTPGDPAICANPSPIPSKFPAYIQPGAVLDPTRLLVASVSNFGAPLPASGGLKGSLLSIDASGSAPLDVPSDFDRNGDQEATLGGAVQMFSANSPHWLNSVNNPNAVTAQYAGVGNPLGLSNNNGFGRIWPANSPFGLDRKGSSTILDPTGLPLAGAPNPLIAPASRKCHSATISLRARATIAIRRTRPPSLQRVCGTTAIAWSLAGCAAKSRPVRPLPHGPFDCPPY